MEAVIMAGGAGTRLRPLTVNRPKPMVPIVHKPVLAHILDLLRSNGFDEVVITLHYFPEAVRGYFGDGENSGVSIRYSVEDRPMGTAGSVKLAAPNIEEEQFLVISGDALTDFDLRKAIEFHREKGALATIVLYRVPVPLDYGVVVLDEGNRVVRFQEKPEWRSVLSDTVNTGIYVLSAEVLGEIPSDSPSDFSADIFPKLLEEGAPVYGYVADGYWCDVGDLREYLRANTDYLYGKLSLPKPGIRLGDEIWAGENVEIAPDARLYGPIYLGNDVKIKAGVEIHGPSVIRDGAIVDNYASIERSIVWRMAYIGEGVHLHGSIIGRQVVVKPNAHLMDASVVGDNTVVGSGAVIYSGVKIWPRKEIENGAEVRESIVWSQRRRKGLFSRFGVTGMVNVDLTPEFAAKLGAAFASILPKGSVVTINRDPHPSSRMLKRAVISGLPSGGVNVLDLRSMPIPVARYYTNFSTARGGVHVRLSPFDQRVVDIKFFDESGIDLGPQDRRQVERVFFREDFRRAYLDDIGLISYASDVIETYREGFLGQVDFSSVKNAGRRLVVDYAHSVVSLVMPQILDRIGVENIPLNAYVDPRKIAILEDVFNAELQQMGKIVQALDNAIGIRFDVSGEKLFMSDETGRVVPNQLLGATMAMLALRRSPGSTIVVPVTLSSVFEEIAKELGGYVVRTPQDIRALVLEVNEREGSLGVDGEGSFVCGCFQPAPDALFMSVKLLELMSDEQLPLSELVRRVPPFFMASETIHCPWELKGKVMLQIRRFTEQYPRSEIDGIKVFLGEREWALIRPDPDNPTIQVSAEGGSEERAKEIAEEYASMVRGILEA